MRQNTPLNVLMKSFLRSSLKKSKRYRLVNMPHRLLRNKFAPKYPIKRFNEEFFTILTEKKQT
ncbi:hypothetical protein V5H41_29365, partial [Salmonella enterica]